VEARGTAARAHGGAVREQPIVEVCARPGRNGRVHAILLRQQRHRRARLRRGAPPSAVADAADPIPYGGRRRRAARDAARPVGNAAAHPLQALEERLRKVGRLGRARQQRGGQLARVAHQRRAPAGRQQLQRHQRRRLQRLRGLPARGARGRASDPLVLP
jgi:hypothetical protein